MKGMAAGAGAAALVSLALKKVDLGKVAKALGVEDLGGLTSNLGDSVGSGIGDKVTDKVDEAGGPAGMLKDAVKDALPFGGGSGGKGGVDGVGKGRRMPVQQSVDIGAPIETVYNQWTQFEDWSTFMHRVTRVTQEDDCTVSFATKIWGKTKEFTAKIETQRPNERIKWSVSQGMTHTGVVTFHELGPNLTRVLLGLDVQPGSLIEKAARGMRHVKRGARADLHRFKALIEMAGEETGAWRGVIEDGELVEEHDPSYDEERQYADLDDLVNDSDEDNEENEDDEGKDDEEQAEEGPKAQRSQRQRPSHNGSQEDESEKPRSGSTAKAKSSSSRSSGGRSSSRGGSSKGQSSGRQTRSRSSKS
ncbi:MAG: SRPBCC family protein [Actinobacteria bacterium]|nr:SRPBCC family protein [Actinomycetota bacterium]